MAWMLVGALGLPVAAQTTDGGPVVLVRVAGVEITVAQFAAVLQQTAREKYWHSGVPESERAAFERQVANDMADRVLLAQEAERRGLVADEDDLEEQVEAVDARNTGLEGWDEAREDYLPSLREQLAARMRIDLLERQVRTVTPPSEDDVRRYYAEHPEKFTQPPRFRVSAILLRVPPSSPSSDWQAAAERAGLLRDAILAGGDFAATAREYSDDVSASSGGDLGFQHEGMLGEEVESVLREMPVGSVSEPLLTLDGVVLVRLAERVDPALQPYDLVAERARGLLERDLQDAAWDELLASLRAAHAVEIDESLLTPVTVEPSQN